MQAVEAYIESQEGKQREIMRYLHEWLMEQPDMVAKIRYKIPFYYRKSWICYLNPRKGDQVELAFLRGNELSNEQGLLDSRGRKQVAGLSMSSLEDLPLDSLREVIQEAIILDEEVPYASKRKKT
jgi:hypothetical protein